MTYFRISTRISALFCLLAVGSVAQAQADYPSRAIRLVVPFTAGGAADAIARPLAAALSKSLGQPVVVENKSGANSTLGVQYVARAPADGYTLLFGSDAGLSLAPNIQANLAYDVARDFTPLAVLAFTHQVLVINAGSSIRSVQDLARAAQAQPSAIPYASIGIGSLSNISMEALAKRMNTTMNHVPYQGVAPAITDLIGGQVQVMLAAISAPLPHIKAGKLRAIGFAGPARSPLLPDVPTIAEQGYPGFQSRGWFGVIAPAATPPAVVARLQVAIAKVAENPSFQQDVILANGYETPQLKAEELAGFLASEKAASKTLIDPIRSRLR